MTEYKTTHICRNCNSHVDLLIPFGMTVKEYLKDQKCEVCGCSPTSIIVDE